MISIKYGETVSRTTPLLQVALLLVAITLGGCDNMILRSDRHSSPGGSEPPKTGPPSTEPPTETDGPATFLDPPQVATVSGSIDLPLTVPLSTLTVQSLASSTPVSDRGEFTELNIIDEGASQLIFLTDENEVAIGVAYVPSTADGGELTITSESLALGLIKLSPVIWFLTEEREQAVLREAKSNSLFKRLVNNIETVLRDAPEFALDYDAHPAIYVDAMQIGVESLSNVAGRSNSTIRVAAQSSTTSTEGGVEQVPHVADADGKGIKLINPTQIFYGVQVVPLVEEDPIEGGLLEPKNDVIRGRGGLIDMMFCRQPTDHPSCPAIINPYFSGTIYVPTSPRTKEIEIGYGVSMITFFGGFNTDQGNWLDPTTAVGRATWANFLKSCGVILDAVGLAPTVGNITAVVDPLLSDPIVESLLANNAERIANSGLDLGPLRDALLTSTNVIKLAGVLANYLSDNWDKFSKTFFKPVFLNNNYRLFLKEFAEVVPHVGQALTAVGIVNESIPFLSDLLLAPPTVVYEIRHRPAFRGRSRVFMEVTIDELEEPSASVKAEVGDDALELDASLSSDEYDVLEDLKVRWDLDNDGKWEDSWTSDHQVEWKCDREPHRVNLEVRDLDGLVGSASHRIAAEAPMATLEVDVNHEDLSVTAYAHNSYDNCTAKLDLRYGWDFDRQYDVNSVPFSSSIAVGHTYESPGLHSVHLWVKDRSGNIGHAYREVQIGIPETLVGLHLRFYHGPFDVAFVGSLALLSSFPSLTIGVPWSYSVIGENTAIVVLFSREPDVNDSCRMEYETQLELELSFQDIPDLPAASLEEGGLYTGHASWTAGCFVFEYEDHGRSTLHMGSSADFFRLDRIP